MAALVAGPLFAGGCIIEEHHGGGWHRHWREDAVAPAPYMGPGPRFPASPGIGMETQP
jgi:hypothetical protein